MFEPVIETVTLLLIMGAGLGLVIGLFAKFFAVKHDPKIAETEEMLPGVNCGACGYAGCADFARALVEGEVTPDACPVSDPEVVESIAGKLGVSLGGATPMVAVVRCGGDNKLSKWLAEYNGVADCRHANLVGATKACSYGCLGLGSCARACPFGAIEMTANGLAIVHPDICTGCEKCVATCPRQLIIMTPKNAPLHNLCNNPQKGGVTAKICKVSCIGCRKCVKEAGEGQMTMDGFLARVNYDDPPGPEVAEVCPTKCLQPSLLIKNTVPAMHHAEEESAKTKQKETANA